MSVSDIDSYYKNLEHICIDIHREKRCLGPETIFCQDKTTAEILTIAEHFHTEKKTFFATRVSENAAHALCKNYPEADYNDRAKTVVMATEPLRKRGKVVVVSAGASDGAVLEEAAVTAEVMGSNVERITDCGVAGIHRILAKISQIRDANAAIVVAGMDGALPSVIGGLVETPIIAVPTSIGYGACFEGVAPLLTMLNSCAAGVSVVNIDNGFGAGFQASMINKKVVEASLQSTK